MNVYSLAYKRIRMWEIVPENLASAMKRAGVNQSQLAQIVGVKQPSIGRLLSGETKTTRAINLIAEALSTTVGYLRGEEVEAGLPDGTPTPARAEFRSYPIETEALASQVIMPVTLPSEDALAAMFEGLLSIVPPEATRAEAARILARRLPSGFAAIGPVAPDPDMARETGGATAPRSPAKDRSEGERPSRR